jgi:hypothetical protein
MKRARVVPSSAMREREKLIRAFVVAVEKAIEVRTAERIRKIMAEVLR